MNRLLPYLAACAALATTTAMAQHFPAKPVRIVVPFAPGGANDVIARVVAQRLAEPLGQQVLVDNRGGAGGAIGADLVAKAPPDGYTLLLANPGPNAINPVLQPKTPYDPIRDFSMITLVAVSPQVLGSIQPMLGSQHIRVIGVAAAARTSLLPGVPAIAESGVADFEVVNWFGIVGPASVQRPVVERLNRAINQVVNSADSKERFAGMGFVPRGTTPEELDRHIRSEIAPWDTVIRSQNIKPE